MLERFRCFCFSVVLCWRFFLHSFVNLFSKFGVILVSFWCHFGTLGGSFGVCWGLLATLGLPRAPLKGPSRKSDENVGSFTALWTPLGVPLGTIFVIFCVLSLLVLYVFLIRFFEGFWILGGPTPTVKTMVSCTRNHCFHISTWSSTIIENCV